MFGICLLGFVITFFVCWVGVLIFGLCLFGLYTDFANWMYQKWISPSDRNQQTNTRKKTLSKLVSHEEREGWIQNSTPPPLVALRICKQKTQREKKEGDRSSDEEELDHGDSQLRR